MGDTPKFGMGTSNPVDAALEVITYGIVSEKPHINVGEEAMRGTRSHVSERTIEGVETCRGPIVAAPNLTEVGLWLPWMGFSVASNVYSLTEGLTSRFMTYDQGEGVVTHQGVKCNTWEIAADVGNAWRWNFECLAEKELAIGASGSFPSLTITEDNPLALHHATLELLGVAREFTGLRLRGNNMLDPESFNYDYTKSIIPTDRIIDIELTVPYDSTHSDLRRPGVVGDEGEIVFTYGARSLTIALANIQFPRAPVEIRGKTRKFLRLNGRCRMEGTTRELVITVDNTP